MPVETFEIDGEIWGAGLPTGAELEAMFALADEAEVDENLYSDDDNDPEGWRYYTDAIDVYAVAWTHRYAERHPDDEYIQSRLFNMRSDFKISYVNEIYKELYGTDLPGYDEKRAAAAD
jgi:hypothetical protein